MREASQVKNTHARNGAERKSGPRPRRCFTLASGRSRRCSTTRTCASACGRAAGGGWRRRRRRCRGRGWRRRRRWRAGRCRQRRRRRPCGAAAPACGATICAAWPTPAPAAIPRGARWARPRRSAGDPCAAGPSRRASRKSWEDSSSLHYWRAASILLIVVPIPWHITLYFLLQLFPS